MRAACAVALAIGIVGLGGCKNLGSGVLFIVEAPATTTGGADGFWVEVEGRDPLKIFKQNGGKIFSSDRTERMFWPAPPGTLLRARLTAQWGKEWYARNVDPIQAQIRTPQ